MQIFPRPAGHRIFFFIMFLTLGAHAQLVSNGSFENTPVGPVALDGIDGWVLEVGGSVATPPDFEIVEDGVQHGTRALKVVVNSTGVNAWDVQAVADSIPVVPGKTYQYSVWARTDHPGSQIALTVGNYSFNEYGAIRPATLSDEWQEFTFEFTITDQRTWARAPIHFSYAANVGDAIYIDNLRIIDRELEQLSRIPVVIEAESGSVGSDFAELTEGGITYVQIQTDGADFNPPVWEYPGFTKRVITCEVTFPVAGTYNLFARLRVGPQTFNDDSFLYGNGFGVKDTANADDWIIANQLQVAGFADSSQVVHEAGGLGEGIWKWVNLSQNMYHEAPTTFTVDGDSQAVIFQMGGRETGLDIDRIAFGRADLFYTVGNLENGEPGSTELPGEVWEGPPFATGHPKFLGSAYSNAQAPNFGAYWNQVTPENAGKWGSVESTRDVMNWGAMDAAYNFAKTNGFPIRYHILIWGNQQPVWIETLPPGEQLEEIEEWFAAVAARYPDIDYLEVVNEPLHDPPAGPGNGNYIDALGGSNDLYGTGWDWIIKSFELARQYFPDSTKLMINDYSIVNDNNATTTYLTIINLLKDRGLIDVIGVQGHAFSTRGPVGTMINNLTRLGNTGLPVQICEMDIDGPTDEVQLQDYQRIFSAFWEHPAVEGITLWGWRPGLWRHDQGAYLIDLDGSERPALIWLRDYVRSTVSINDPPQALPRYFRLEQNYPNPFNPATQINYYLPKTTRVTFEVYDLLGRHVQTLVNERQSSGQYTVTFNAGNLASGIYFYRLATPSYTDVKRMLLLK